MYYARGKLSKLTSLFSLYPLAQNDHKEILQGITEFMAFTLSGISETAYQEFACGNKTFVLWPELFN